MARTCEHKTRPGAGALAWRAAVIACAVVVSGCATRTAPSAERTLVGDRPTPISEDQWPARSPTVFPLSGPTLGTTRSDLIERAVSFFVPQEDWEDWRRATESGASMRRVGMIGRGHLSEIVTPREEGERAPKTGWSSLLLFFSAAADGDLPYVPRRKGPTPPGGPALESSLTTMRLYEPAGGGWRGLVVHVTGLRGSGSEAFIEREFTSRGWAVLSVPPPSKAVERESLARWTGEALDHGDGLAAAAKRFARLTDWAMAEWAYAAEAGVRHVLATHPALKGAPVAAIGCSIGAMALPAVAARLDPEISCAVLVAGGGPLLEVLRDSDATVAEMRVRWTDRELSEEEWGTLIEMTRRESLLDPLRAAEFLRGVPVLQVHAAWDGIVPAHTGDELYEALGRPERWSYPAGHIGMFMILPSITSDLAGWVEAHTRKPSGEVGTP